MICLSADNRKWLAMAFTILLLLSCSGGSDSDTVEPTPNDGPSVLNIYVYAPGQAVPTRGNEGEVKADPETEENAIHTLQIWVFTHEETPSLVTYFMTNSFTPVANTDTYKFELPIDETYASTPAGSRQPVDVYVLANVTANNCGLTLNETTTKAQLEAAVIGESYFGLTTPVTEVPSDGLPMSGALREQTVTGTKPVLTIRPSSESNKMAAVKLARAVSKVRFVFSCSTDFDGLKITKATFNEEMIPTQEYLFLKAQQEYSPEQNYYHLDDTPTYNAAETSPLVTVDETAICTNPAHYAWDRLITDQPTSTAQDYEDLIKEGLTIQTGETTPRLTERRLYLRESDKQLAGKIYYKVKNKGEADYGDEQQKEFEMVPPEGETPWTHDFSRNHTWIVYSYLAWANLRVVDVHFSDWVVTDPGEHPIYNW